MMSVFPTTLFIILSLQTTAISEHTKLPISSGKSRSIYEGLLEDDIKDIEVEETSKEDTKDSKEEETTEASKEDKKEDEKVEEKTSEESKEDEAVEEASKDESKEEETKEEESKDEEATDESLLDVEQTAVAPVEAQPHQ